MDAVVFDLDGALCDVSSVLHHVEGDEKDFDAFHAASAGCPPHEHVADAARSARAAGHAVVIVTGRSAPWRDTTIDWLTRHDIPYDAIYTRFTDDFRAEAITKKSLLDLVEKHGYVVNEAWEDSPAVIDLYASRGITVHSVP